jgi:RsmE family RNA methyltransferase
LRQHRLVLAIGELLAVHLDRKVAELAHLGCDLAVVRLGKVARKPRRQQRIVIELVPETRRFLEERHDANLPRYCPDVNLLLIDPGELRSDGTCVIADRRMHHLRTVLGVEVGSTIKAGVLGGAQGTGEVIAIDGDGITLRLALTNSPSRPLDVELLLAVPRPKVITRTIEIAASFGVRRIDMTNAWRVDKSYLRSPRLDPMALTLAARFGAEQGGTTHLPEIAVHDRLMGVLDARFPAPDGSAAELRLVAHPSAPPIEDVVTSRTSVVLAIGPEGGWIERELETFVARGFRPVSLGAPILRVEAAVASALGQLLLLHRLRGAH